jgi:hypothetical protein
MKGRTTRERRIIAVEKGFIMAVERNIIMAVERSIMAVERSTRMAVSMSIRQDMHTAASMGIPTDKIPLYLRNMWT